MKKILSAFAITAAMCAGSAHAYVSTETHQYGVPTPVPTNWVTTFVFNTFDMTALKVGERINSITWTIITNVLANGTLKNKSESNTINPIMSLSAASNLYFGTNNTGTLLGTATAMKNETITLMQGQTYMISQTLSKTTATVANFADFSKFTSAGAGNFSVFANSIGSTSLDSSSNVALDVSTYSNIIATVDYEVVPEPASLAMLGLGLFAIAALRRRQS